MLIRVYVVKMSSAAVISQPLQINGVNPSPVLGEESLTEMASLSLITRILLWLSQICGDATAQVYNYRPKPQRYRVGEYLHGYVVTRGPNRRQRKMRARRARGIMPASRYPKYAKIGPLPCGISPAQLLEHVKRCKYMRSFRTSHWKYYVIGGFYRRAMKVRFCLGVVTAQEGPDSNAPISPD